MTRPLFFFAILLTISSCSHVTQLSPKKISGERNMIFIRPFAANKAPDEVAKLISEKFYTTLSSENYFKNDKAKKYLFDFYLGQPCPDGFDCYYITGEVFDYKYDEGCCGRAGVETSARVLFWDDLTKKPIFEVSEWNSEVFEPEDLSQLEAIDLLAEDTSETLTDSLLKELSRN